MNMKKLQALPIGNKINIIGRLLRWRKLEPDGVVKLWKNKQGAHKPDWNPWEIEMI